MTLFVSAFLAQVRFLRRRVLLPVAALLLSCFVCLSSSSEAEDVALGRSVSGLERMWSGVAGCADVGSDEKAIASALENDAVPDGARSRTYNECGKQALRSAASALLLEAMEDAARLGGLGLLGEGFRLDSGLSWVWGENPQGEIDLTIPLWRREAADGVGAALFLQPGLAGWSGQDGATRWDGNLGLVYRQGLGDVVVGGSVFYDHGFRRDHRRVSFGVDAAGEVLRGGVNYYHPLSGWRGGRTRYEEQALRGADARLGAVVGRLRLDADVGVWRFRGAREGAAVWRPSYRLEAGWRVRPGIFFEGGYERHDDDESIGERWSVGLAFRYVLPGLEAAEGGGFGGVASAGGLWRLVERERRILYEERLAIVPAVVSLSFAPPRVTEREGASSILTLTLDKALEREVALTFLEALGSTADASDYALREREVTLAPGEVRAEIQVDITDDETAEPEEHLHIRAQAPADFAGLLDTHRTARLTILASDDLRVGIVGLAADSAGTLSGNREATAREGEVVLLDLALGDSAPAGGIALAVSAVHLTDSADAMGDVSVANVSVAEGAQSGQVRVVLREDGIAESDEAVRVSIAEGAGFPAGWSIDAARDSFTLVIAASDNLAFFNPTESVVSWRRLNPSTLLALELNRPAPVGGLRLALASSNSRAARARQAVITIPEGRERFEFPVDILTRSEVGGGGLPVSITARPAAGAFPVGWGVDPERDRHIITITDADFSIGFLPDLSASMTEPASGRVTERFMVAPSVAVPSVTTVRVGTAESGTAREGAELDFTVSPESITFLPADGTTPKPVIVTVNADEEAEADEHIDLRLTEHASEFPVLQGWRMGRDRHRVTILANDNVVGFAAAVSDNVAESATVLRLPLALDPVPVGGIALRASVVDGDGDGERDVSVGGGASAMVTIGDNADPHIAVVVEADGLAEGAETAVVTIAFAGTPPVGWSLGQESHTLRLLPNGNSIGFADAVSSGGEGERLRLALAMSRDAPAQGLELRVSVADGDEDERADVTAAESIVRIAAGAVARRDAAVAVDIVADGLAENSETARVSIAFVGAPPTGWSLARNTHDITIGANENTARLAALSTFLIPADIVAEGDRVAMTIMLSNPPPSGVTLRLRVSGVTLAPGEGDDIEGENSATVTFTGNETSKSVSFVIDEDGVAEDAETIRFTLADADASAGDWGGVDADNDTHEVTVVANEKRVGFAREESSAREDAGSARVALRLNFAPPSGGVPLDVSYGGSAVAPADYARVASVVVRPADVVDGVAELVLRIVDDAVSEGDENVILTLREGGGDLPEGWALGDITRHVVTIQDDETARIGFADALDDVVVEGTASDALTVRADTPIPAAFSLNASVHDGSECGAAVVASGEAVLSVARLDFSPAVASRSFTVRAIDDDASVGPEADEAVCVRLAAGVGFPPRAGSWEIAPATHALTIPANDNVVSLVEADATIVEDGGVATLTVMPSNPASAEMMVTLTLAGYDADALTITGSGWDGANNRLTIPANAASASLTLTAQPDDDGVSEVIIFSIAQASHVTGAPAGWADSDGVLGDDVSYTLTITDDDSGSNTIAFASASTVGEVSEDAGTHNLGLTLSTTSGNAFDVTVAAAEIVNGAGQAVSDDEIVVAGTFAVTPSNTTQLPVTINADTDPEDDRVFRITISNPTDPLWTVGQASHDFTIGANDKTVQFAASGNPSEVAEGDTVTLNLVTNYIPAANVVVGGSVVDAGDDLGDIAGSIASGTAGAGTGSGTLTFAVADPATADPEGDEEFTITLTIPSAAVDAGWGAVSPSSHTITVLANDNTISLVEADATIAEDGGVATLTVMPSNPTSAEMMVTLTLAGYDADALTITGSGWDGANSRLTIPANAASASLTLTAQPDDDGVSERVTFSIAAAGDVTGAPVGWADSAGVLGDDVSYTLTITDDDSGSNTIAFSSASTVGDVSEDVGTHNLGLTLSTTSGNAFDVTVVAVEIVNGAGQEISDNEIVVAGTFAVTPASTTQLPVTINADADPEDDRVFRVTISNPTDPLWQVGSQATHEFTIGANDKTVAFAASGNPSQAREGESVTLNLVTNYTPAANVIVGGSVVDTGDDLGDIAGSIASGTVGAGTGIGSLTFAVANPATADPEGDEEFTITLTIPSAAVDAGWGAGALNTHTITILANDNTISLVEADATIAEDGGVATLTVMPSNPASVEMMVTLTLAGYDADALTITGAGWDGANNRLTIPANAASASLTLTAQADDDGVSERVTFSIAQASHVTGAPVGWADSDGVLGDDVSYTLTITDDDSGSNTIAFASASTTGDVSEDVGTHNLGLTLSTTSGNAFDVTVAAVEIVNGAGQAVSDDEIAVASTFAVTPASTTQLPVTINADADPEDDRVFRITISNPTDPLWTVGQATHDFTIGANDKTVAFAASGNPSEVAEGDTVTLNLVTNYVPAAAVVVGGSVVDTSDDLGDITGSIASGTVGAGAGTGSLTFAVADPATADPEGDEEFTISLTIPSAAVDAGWGAGALNTHTITILANDNTISLVEADATIAEDGGVATLTVMPSNPASAEMMVILTLAGYESSALTITGAGWDGANSRLTIPANAASAQLTLTAQPDDDGVSEVVSFSIAQASHVTGVPVGWADSDGVLGDDVSYTLTITDDDSGSNTIAFASASTTGDVSEDAGTHNLGLTLSTTSGNAFDVTVAAVEIVNGAGQAVSDDEIVVAGTFAVTPASTTQLPVTINADADPEDDRVFRITISNPTDPLWQVGSQAAHGFTIGANDKTVAFAASGNPSEVREGESVTLNLVTNYVPAAAVVVGGSVVDTGDDLGDITGSIASGTVGAGTGSGTLTFAVADPATADPEGDEEFTISLTIPSAAVDAGWGAGALNTHTITILANDNTISLAEADATIAEDGGVATLTVMPSNPTSAEMMVTLTLAGYDADAITITGAGWDGANNRFTIPANAASASLTLTAQPDDDGVSERVTFSIATAGDVTGAPAGWADSDGVLGDDVSYTLTITDDDSGSNTIAFASASTTGDVSEDAGTHNLGLTLSTTSGNAFDVTVAAVEIVNGAGQAISDDEIAVAGTFAVTPSSTTQLPVTINADTDPEGDRVFRITISNPTDPLWTVGQATHDFTIGANDKTVQFAASGNPSQVREGESVTLNLVTNYIPAANVVVGGSVVDTGDDLGDITGSIVSGTVGAGTGSGSLTFAVADPATADAEGDEEFTITLTIPSAAVDAGWGAVSPSSHTITVLANDNTISLVEADATIVEDGGVATLTVMPSNPASAEMMVTLTLAGYDADALTITGSGWDGANNRLTIPANAASASLTLTAQPDDDGVSERVTFSIAAAGDVTGAPVGWADSDGVLGDDVSYTLTITDDDSGANTIAFASASTVGEVSEDAGTHNLGLTLSTTSGNAFDVTVAAAEIVNGAGQAVSDDEIVVAGTFAVTPSNTTQLPVTINADTDPEDDRVFRITISNPTDPLWTVGQATHDFTIGANDKTVAFAASGNPSQVREGESVTLNLVTNYIPAANVVVGGSVVDTGDDLGDIAGSIVSGTAGAGTGSGSLTFAVADPATADPEGDEEFTISLTIPSAAVDAGWGAVSPSSHTITVLANDNTISLVEADATIVEDGGVATLTVMPSNPSSAEMMVTLTLAGYESSALTITGAGWDGANNRLTIPANAASASLTLTAQPDDDGVSEVIGFSIAQASHVTGAPTGWADSDGVLGDDVSYTLTITDDDMQVRFAVADGTTSAIEGDSDTTASIALSANFAAPADGLHITGFVANDTGNDIGAISGVIAAGQTSGNLSVTITGDTAAEEEESFTLTLDAVTLDDAGKSAAAGWAIDPADAHRRHTITIPANDNFIAFGTDADSDGVIDADSTSGSVTEGDVGDSVTHAVPLTISNPLPSETILAVSLAGDTDAVTVSGTDNSGFTTPSGGTAPTFSGGALTLPQGGTGTVSLTVAINPDDSDGGDERVTFTIADAGTTAPTPTGWGGITPNTSYALAIADNDGGANSIGFAAASTTGEVSEDAGTHNLALTLSATTGAAFTLDVAAEELVNGNPQAVSDNEIAVSSPFTITPAGTTQLPVTIHADANPEDDRSFRITLSNPSDPLWSIGQATHDFTIAANDKTVAFAATSASSVNERFDGAIVFALATNYIPAAAVSVSAVVTPDAATPGASAADLGIITGRIAVADPPDTSVGVGVGSGTLTVTLAADDATEAPEADEDFTVTLSIPAAAAEAGWSATAPTSRAFTILANDNVVGIASGQDASVNESAGTFNLGLTLTNPVPAEGLPLGLRITSGDADAVSFVPSFTVTRANSGGTAAGEKSYAIPITLADVDSEDDTVTFTLFADADEIAVWGRVAADTHTLTIIDDVKTIGFTETTSEQAEPDSSSAAVPLGVLPSEALPAGGAVVSVSVDATAANAASEGGSADYTIATTTLTWNAGESQEQSVMVSVNADTDIEEDETITVTLTQGGTFPAVGWVIYPATHTITIPANDKVVRFADTQPAGSDSAAEGTMLQLALATNTAAPAQGLAIGASITSGDADGGDFTMSGAIAANAAGGDHANAFTIAVVDDTLAESDEAFTITLDSVALGISLLRGGVSAAGWSIAATGVTHDFTIPANDNIVQFVDAGPTPATEGTDASVNLTLTLTNEAPSGGLPLQLTVNPNDADAIAFTTPFTILPADTVDPSGDATAYTYAVPITIREDSDLDSESLTFTLAQGSAFPTAWGSASGQTTHILNITDDDAVPGVYGFRLATSSVYEPYGPGDLVTGDTPHRVEIFLTNPDTFVSTAGGTDAQLTLTVSGSAGAGDATIDGVAGSAKTITIDAATGTAEAVALAIHPDHITEPDETIVLTLSNPVGFPAGWIPERMTHTITIPTNDNVVRYADASGFRIQEGGPITSIDKRISFGNPAPAGGLPLQFFIPLLADDGGFRGGDFTMQLLSANGNSAPFGFPGGAGAPGSGGTPTSNIITAPAGASSADLRVTAIDDNIIEGSPKDHHIEIQAGAGFPERWGRVSPHRSENRFRVFIDDNDNVATAGWDDTVAEVQTQVEPASGSVDITLTVRPSAAVPALTNLRVGPEGASTAALGEDFDFSTGFFSWRTGESHAQTVTVTIHSDNLSEEEEVIIMGLRPADPNFPRASNWRLGRRTHRIVIPANGNIAQFAASGPTAVTEGTDTRINLALHLTGEVPLAGLPLQLSASPNDTSAISTASSFTLFPIDTADPSSGQSIYTASVPVAIREDADADGETLTLTLSAGRGFPSGWGGVSGRVTHTLEITDDDAANSIGFLASASSVEEPTSGTSEIMVLVRPSSPVPVGETLNLTETRSGTAEGRRADYSIQYDHGLVWNAGDNICSPGAPCAAGAAKAIPVTIHADEVAEADETITITLSAETALPSGWSLGRSAHTLTIPANDNAAQFAADAPASVNESAGTLDLNLTLDNPAPREGLPLRLAITSGDQDAASFASNFTVTQANSGGSSSGLKTYTVTLDVRDADADDDTITLTLSAGSGFPNGWGGVSGRTTHTLAITDTNEDFHFTNAMLSQFHHEPESGVVEAVFTLQPSAAVPSGGASVRVATDGTATEGVINDYTLSPAVLTWNAGESAAKSFVISIRPDNFSEPNEHIDIALSKGSAFPSGWNLPAEQASVVIASNDNFVEILPFNIAGGTGSPVSAVEGSDANISLLLRFSSHVPHDPSNPDGPNSGVPLQLTVDSGDADAVAFTSSFRVLAGDDVNIGPLFDARVPITILNDADAEDELITLRLNPGPNFPDDWGRVAGRITHTLTITDDDAKTVGFVADNVTLAEPPISDANYGIPVIVSNIETFTAEATADVRLMLEVSGSADHLDTPPDFSIAGLNVLTKTIVIDAATGIAEPIALAIHPEGEREGDETIVLTLSDPDGSLPSGWRLGTAVQTVTIPSNDNLVAFVRQASSAVEGEGTIFLPLTLSRPVPDTDTGLHLRLHSTAGASDAARFTSPFHITRANTGGGNSYNIPIVIVEDGDADDETVTLTLSPDSGFPVSWGNISDAPGNEHVLTILDNDKVISFAASQPAGSDSGAEGGVISLVLTTNALAPSEGLVVGGRVTSGSNEGDFTMSGSIAGSAAAGEHAGAFSIVVADDALAESGESFTIILDSVTLNDPAKSAARGWSIASPNTHEFTIPANDEPPPAPAPSPAPAPAPIPSAPVPIRGAELAP